MKRGRSAGGFPLPLAISSLAAFASFPASFSPFTSSVETAGGMAHLQCLSFKVKGGRNRGDCPGVTSPLSLISTLGCGKLGSTLVYMQLWVCASMTFASHTFLQVQHLRLGLGVRRLHRCQRLFVFVLLLRHLFSVCDGRRPQKTLSHTFHPSFLLLCSVPDFSSLTSESLSSSSFFSSAGPISFFSSSSSFRSLVSLPSIFSAGDIFCGGSLATEEN